MTTPGQHGPLDLPAIRTWNQRNAASREEYAHSPQTHRNVSGPCITPGCRLTAYTQRGVCRACLKGE